MAVVHSHGQVRWCVSERADGDFCLERADPEELKARQRAIIDHPWTLVRQVHGVETFEVVTPGSRTDFPADIVGTSLAGAVLGIWVGDCVPLLLISPRGRIVMAHIGWRGLVAGAVSKAVALMNQGDVVDPRQPGPIGVLGPHIGPCCYEFSPGDLNTVATSIGVGSEAISPPHPRYATVLDMTAAVSQSLVANGVTDLRHAPGPKPVCTGCDDRWFSHRTRIESERHVMAAWRAE
jgi:polyphenol oxidase